MRSDEYVLVGSRTVLAAKHGARGNFFKCCAVDRKSGVEVVVAILKSKWGQDGGGDGVRQHEKSRRVSRKMGEAMHCE